MPTNNSSTFKLTKEQQDLVVKELNRDLYEKTSVPHTQIAVKGNQCNISLYNSGKLLIQGKGGQDWVNFTLEPEILKEVVTGYDNVLHPEFSQPHIGIDESGKGDFFGPLVTAAVYVDEKTTPQLLEAGVRDSKSISSDRQMLLIASRIMEIVGNKQVLLKLRPETFNKLYAKMSNMNQILAWSHARVLEDLLEKVPNCPRAVADKFGPEIRTQRALMKRGREIELTQRTKAEDDPAVAAASILARAEFVRTMQQGTQYFGFEINKGVSEKVKAAASRLIEEHGPTILPRVAKINFKTTDEVLARSGFSRKDILEENDNDAPS